MMNTIVLGLDSSKSSQAAVRWTAAIAAETGAQVVAVHVMARWSCGHSEHSRSTSNRSSTSFERS